LSRSRFETEEHIENVKHLSELRTRATNPFTPTKTDWKNFHSAITDFAAFGKWVHFGPRRPQNCQNFLPLKSKIADSAQIGDC